MTDAEYIEKVIAGYDARKKRAVLFCLISIISVVSTCLMYASVTRRVSELSDLSTAALFVGNPLTETELDIVDASTRLAYFTGIRAGQALAALATASGISIGYSLYLLFWSRKERLIKELYEKV